MPAKLCLIGIDGLRIDIASESGVAPTLVRLATSGSLTPMWMIPPTDSGPGWATLLTGYSHEETNVYDNEFVSHRMGYCPDILSQMWFRNYQSKTMAIGTWRALFDPNSRGPIIHTRIDQQRCGLHRIVIRDGEIYGCRKADEEVQAIACRDIVQQGREGNFIYFESVDEAGHIYGSQSQAYKEAISAVDEHIRCVLKAINERVKKYHEDWLIAITTDHGHLPEGGHGGDSELERRSFLLLNRFGKQLPELGYEISPLEVTPLLLRMSE